MRRKRETPLSSTIEPASLSPWREWAYPGEVVQVAFSNDGRRIAFGGDAGSIEFWECIDAQWNRLFTYVSPDGELPLFALSPDGTRFVVARKDCPEIQAYFVASGQHIASFKGARMYATCVTWSPQGDITSGSHDGWIYVWDWNKTHEAFAFKLAYKANPKERDGRPIRAIAWSPDGKVLTTVEEGDPCICIYSYAKRDWKQTKYRSNGEPVQVITWRPDGKRLAIAYGTQIEIQARQPRSKPLLTCTDGSMVIAITWSDDGRFLLSLSQSGTVRIWNAETGYLAGSLSEENDDIMRSMATGLGGLVLVGCRDWMVRLYDALITVGYRVSGEESRELTSPEPWSFVQCATCLYGGDLAEYQHAAQVENIARIEAADAVCSTCSTYLATGKPAPTGHPLKDFFSIDVGELLDELDVDGWTEGGCWVAACGLLRWIETSAECPQARLMIVEAEQRGPGIADHALVELVVDGKHLCLDAEGVAGNDEFLNNWMHTYRRSACALVPLDEQRLYRLNYRYNSDMSDRIADALHERFGEFRQALLSRFDWKNRG